MANDCKKTKMSPRLCCEYGCLAFLLICIFLIIVAWLAWIWISESTIYLKTENIALKKTYHLHANPSDPRTACCYEKDNKISITVNPRYSRPENQEIILKESDDFLVFVEYTRRRGLNIYPRWKFGDESSFSFYRIIKERTVEDNSWNIKMVFLGAIQTNLYGAWMDHGNRNEHFHHLSISPDGKFIIMVTHGANSYSLGKFRNRDVLLIWEIGDKVVEKDIVDSKGNKIPIRIITEEEEAVTPTSPIRFSASGKSKNSIFLTWEKGNNTDYYNLYRQQETHLPEKKIAMTRSTEFTDSSLAPNNYYYYRIEAVNESSGKTPENRIFAKTKP